jgi:hypothetical protein
MKQGLFLFANVLKETLLRFPAAILASAASTVLLIVMTNFLPLYFDTEEVMGRLAQVAALGFPMFLCCALLAESVKKPFRFMNLALHLAALIILTVYYFAFLQQMYFITATRYIATTLALYLCFVFIPYLTNGKNFELHVIRLLNRALVTGLYSGVLYLGLTAILFVACTLLKIGIQGELYFDLYLVVTGLFAPIFFLSGLTREETHTEFVSYPNLIDTLLKYILAPLAVIYICILYIYLARILITREWPEGIVVHVVLWFSVIVILMIFFMTPGAKASKWTKNFILWVPRFIIPVLAVMFVSLAIRIQAYGFTENRYFALLLGIWATMHMLIFSFMPWVKNIVLPVTLAIFSLFAVFGPLSAYNVSIRSQNERLAALLDKYDMRINGRLLPSKEVGVEDRIEISSILRYFEHRHGFEVVPYLPQGFDLNDMERVFGFSYMEDDCPNRY